MEDVANYVNRIIVMNKGSVMFDDEPKRVFAHGKELELSLIHICLWVIGGKLVPAGRKRPGKTAGGSGEKKNGVACADGFLSGTGSLGGGAEAR